MPYKTIMKRYTDGVNSWMEPEQVWVDPTPEELAKEAELKAIGEDLARQAEDLSAKIKAVLDGKDQ